MPKSAQHLTNFTPLNCVPLSVKTLLGMPNLYTMLCRNMIAASWVIFTAGMASIHLVNMSTPANKYQNPPGAIGRMPIMLIPQIAKGQEISIDKRGLLCFWKNWQSLHFLTTSIMSYFVVG
jgi:hypothetical protein